MEHDTEMLIVFRADANPDIGGGHVMRCLTLATEMERRGADTLFVSAARTIDTVAALRQSGIPCLDADQHGWHDALSDGSVAGVPIDLIVVDSYLLGESFERSLRRFACPILVMDDAAKRRHDCDLLVDMTLGRATGEYAGLVPPHCRILAGSSYALLRAAFAEMRPASLSRRATAGPLKSAFVSLGLTDIGGLTVPIVSALAASGILERIVVTTGRNARSFDEISSLHGSAGIAIHVDPPDIASLMASADVAIGTPGTSSWERCCLGLPSILLVVADNQRDNARALDQAGAARVIPLDSDAPAETVRIVRELAATPGKLAQMSQRAAAVCDGAGASRVGAAIDDLVLRRPIGRLTLRAATERDARRLWLWRNEPDARAMFGDTKPVSWESHAAWLTTRLADPDTLIFIVEADERPCGSVRFHIELTGTAVVSIAMAGHVQGRGYGTDALAMACREAFARRFCERIEARVKRENAASRRIFLKGGFVPAGEEADYLLFQLLGNGGSAEKAR
jgi:UDP-2,4-diacetamido-2,4,6-trideoxy-beta-L-altropyranose hydrolase